MLPPEYPRYLKRHIVTGREIPHHEVTHRIRQSIYALIGIVLFLVVGLELYAFLNNYRFIGPPSFVVRETFEIADHALDDKPFYEGSIEPVTTSKSRSSYVPPPNDDFVSEMNRTLNSISENLRKILKQLQSGQLQSGEGEEEGQREEENEEPNQEEEPIGDPGGDPDPLSGTCSPNRTTATVNEPVEWRVYPSGGVGSYEYEWERVNIGVNNAENPYRVTYNTAGRKNMSLLLSSGVEEIILSCGFVEVSPAETRNLFEIISPNISDIRLSLQDSYYRRANEVEPYGMRNSSWTIGGSFIGVRAKDPGRVTLEQFLSYTEEDIENFVNDYLTSRGRHINRNTSDLVVIDIEGVAFFAHFGRYMEEDLEGIFYPVLDQWKIYIREFREALPNAKLGAWGVLSPQKDGEYTSQYRRQIVAHHLAAEYGVFDQLDVVGPSFYPDYRMHENGFSRGQIERRALMIANETASLRKSNGGRLEVYPYTSLTIFNDNSAYTGLRQDPAVIQLQLEILDQYSNAIDGIIFWDVNDSVLTYNVADVLETFYSGGQSGSSLSQREYRDPGSDQVATAVLSFKESFAHVIISWFVGGLLMGFLFASLFFIGRGNKRRR